MYRRKSWLPRSLSAKQPAPCLLRVAWLAFLVATIVLGPGGGSIARADEPIRVLATTEDYVFADSLRFGLEAQSDSPIVEVILFYGMLDRPIVRRIYPGFAPGKEVKITHTEPVEPGQFAPGTRLRAWWRLGTQDGALLTTETRVFEYTDTNQQWRTLSGAQVDLFWYGRNESSARDLLAKAHTALDRLRSDMGVPSLKRIRIYVYNNQNDMRRATSSRSEGYDEQVTTLGVAMGEDALILLGSHRDVEETLAHELSHIVVGIITDNPYTDLPRWLDEGLAMYAQGKLAAGNQRALEAAISSNSLLSIRSMTSYSGQASQVDLFYGEAYSIVDWMLRELGNEKMQELLAVFSEGVRQEDALKRVYGMGLDELDSRWRASLGLGPRRTPTPPGISSHLPVFTDPLAHGARGARPLALLGSQQKTASARSGPGACDARAARS